MRNGFSGSCVTKAESCVGDVTQIPTDKKKSKLSDHIFSLSLFKDSMILTKRPSSNKMIIKEKVKRHINT